MTADDHVPARPAAPPPDGPVAVLANPQAARGRHRVPLPEILDRLGAAGRQVRLLAADTAAQAEAACRAAVADGAGALVTVGGDGTVHLALQAVAGTPVAFAPVPAGTGNDFALRTGFPADPLAATVAIAEALRAGRTRPVDLARITRQGGAVSGGPPAGGPGADAAGGGVGGAASDVAGGVSVPGGVRWFGAVLAAGFDSIVNERANRMRWPRGQRRYDLAILAELARLRPRRYRLLIDGVPLEQDAVLVAVGNCASYGGGMRICPAADPTDGLLDVVVGAAMTRRHLMRLKPRVYRGTHVADPLVSSYRVRTIELAAEGIVGYADGERIGPLPLTVTVVPAAVRLLR